MKTILTIILVLAILGAGGQEKTAKTNRQKKAEKQAERIAEVTDALNSKAFTMDVRTVNPMQGSTINVTSEYEVRIKNDSLFSYLPYFGRAYTASLPPESPMIFDSPIEEYSIEKKGKGMYQVSAKVKNKMDNLIYFFIISETGSATLSVTSNNRQSISYYGTIEKINRENKKE